MCQQPTRTSRPTRHRGAQKRPFDGVGPPSRQRALARALHATSRRPHTGARQRHILLAGTGPKNVRGVRERGGGYLNRGRVAVVRPYVAGGYAREMDSSALEGCTGALPSYDSLAGDPFTNRVALSAAEAAAGYHGANGAALTGSTKRGRLRCVRLDTKQTNGLRIFDRKSVNCVGPFVHVQRTAMATEMAACRQRRKPYQGKKRRCACACQSRARLFIYHDTIFPCCTPFFAQL